MEQPLSELIFTKRIKMLSRLDGSLFFGKLEVEFFCISESPGQK